MQTRQETKNQVGNFFYEISHNIFMRKDGEIDTDFWVSINITKIEILSASPTKYKLRFSKIDHMFNKVIYEIKEMTRSYSKDSVQIHGTMTTDQLIEKFNNYKIAVQNSDRIADFKKKAILEAMSRFEENKIRDIFSSVEAKVPQDAVTA